MEVYFVGDLAVCAGGAEAGCGEVPAVAALDAVAVARLRPQQEHGDARAEQGERQVGGPGQAQPVRRLRGQAGRAEEAAAAVGRALAAVPHQRGGPRVFGRAGMSAAVGSSYGILQQNDRMGNNGSMAEFW